MPNKITSLTLISPTSLSKYFLSISSTLSISSRIRLNSKSSFANEDFELSLIRDEIDKVDEIDKKYLDNEVGDIKVREVILLGNKIPKVYAKSLIPVNTIENGFSKLGSLGTKPLGDILFEKNIFNKIEVVYSTFSNEISIFWGRKTKYLVRSLPFSVMEIFLIDE